MENLFTLPNELESRKDNVLELVKELTKGDFNVPSGLVFVKLDGSNNDFESIRTELQSGKQSWGILNDLVLSMQLELKNLIQKFEDFYLTKSDYKTYDRDGLSPMEINHLLNAALVRIKRMRYVLNPEYIKSDFFDKKSNNRYTMIKGYWIDDEGTKTRSFSKNICNTEASLEDLVAKIIKSHVKNSVVMEPIKSWRFRPDLIVAVGENNRWAVEIKLQAKDSLIRTYAMLELWKLYKQTYELIK